ncbi:peptide chain release factor N(5)-glutamine methyltransferase [Ruminococcus sp.]
MTSYEAVRRTRAVLTEHGLPDAAFEGDILVQEVLGVHQPVRTLPERTLTESQQETLADMTRRRCCHEPLQYLCGAWEFYGLSFSVGEGVLIPRQDTEVLVEEVLRLRHGTAATRLLDLCSGSGCIPAAVAAHLSGVTGDVVELSARALPYLRRNLNRHAPALHIWEGDALAPPAELRQNTYDIITCNPPYLTAEDMAQLQPEVAFEPASALYGGTDGLDFYRRLTPLWSRRLARGGWLLYEVGQGQAHAVQQLLEQAGLTGCRILPDLAGIGRVVLGQRKERISDDGKSG